MGKKLLLIGGGGHCHSVLDCVLSLNEYEEVGIIDTTAGSYLGVPVIGDDEDIPRLCSEGWTEAFVSVGSVGNTNTRRRLYRMIKEMGLNVPTLIDPTAIIGKGVTIGEGSFVGKRTVINSGSLVGVCAIINTGAVIEHDCMIGDFAHISPGTVLCGHVSVGNDAFVGAGSTVRQLIKIGEKSLIGAGSVLVKDIPFNVKAYGNPCKVVD